MRKKRSEQKKLRHLFFFYKKGVCYIAYLTVTEKTICDLRRRSRLNHLACKQLYAESATQDLKEVNQFDTQTGKRPETGFCISMFNKEIFC